MYHATIPKGARSARIAPPRQGLTHPQVLRAVWLSLLTMISVLQTRVDPRRFLVWLG